MPAELGGHFAAVATPQRVEPLVRVGVDAAVGVRAEEVPQTLGQRRGQPLGAQRVVVGQRRGEARDRNAELRWRSPRPGASCRWPPRSALRKYGATIRVASSGSCVERLLDPVEELGPDDAAAAPDGGHVAGRDAPVVFGAAGLDLVEALGVGDDLRRVQRLADVVDELRRVRGLGRRGRPDARPVVALRWATEPDSARAKTASAMPVTGTPRSSADLTVQRPVPFCSASSRMTSTSGLPVLASVCAAPPR